MGPAVRGASGSGPSAQERHENATRIHEARTILCLALDETPSFGLLEALRVAIDTDVITARAR
jgi:hypothetical protein